jgi:hypothetical protein
MNVFYIDEQKIISSEFDIKNKDLDIKKDYDDLYLDKQYKNLKTIEEKIIKYGLNIKDKFNEDQVKIVNNLYSVV